MSKYNHFLRRSIRLKSFDYRHSGPYYVTICAYQRRKIFGEVVLDRVELSELGCLIDQSWMKTSIHHQHVETDAFIIMPNHIHGILWLMHGRGTACRAPTVEKFGQPVSGSLPTIIRSFKSAVTREWRVRSANPDVRIWQRNYYERVIRNDRELTRLRSYIQQNPLRWEEDKYYGNLKP